MKSYVIVDNLTKGSTLASHGRAADNILTRFKGLMGSDPLGEGEGLLILPSNSIHTHFMRFPIDVVYIDSDQKVLAVDADMQPWRFGRIHRKCRCVLEVPAGTILGTATEVGDQLAILGIEI